MKPTTDFPFLLDNPRAWRTYLGGRMLDALHGDSNGEDGHFPEEWILSTVAARNAGREQFPEEGMSHLRGTDVTLKSVLESDTEGYLGKGAAQPTLLGVGGSACSHCKKIKTENFFSGRAGVEMTPEI